jgi:hypothetical protein
MRASPWTDHKLSLTPYVTAEGGPVVAQAMTRAMGVGSEEMASRVNAMPSSDLSVARKGDRLSWTGTGNYLVVIAPREDEDPVVGFNPDGSREVLYSRADIQGRVLILIQPAEAKNLRTVRQSRVQGVTIQDPDDGSIGGSFSIVMPRRRWWRRRWQWESSLRCTRDTWTDPPPTRGLLGSPEYRQMVRSLAFIAP